MLEAIIFSPVPRITSKRSHIYINSVAVLQATPVPPTTSIFSRVTCHFEKKHRTLQSDFEHEGAREFFTDILHFSSYPQPERRLQPLV